MSANNDRCPSCWSRYELEVEPILIEITTRRENGNAVTEYKYRCSCGHEWERTYSRPAVPVVVHERKEAVT